MKNVLLMMTVLAMMTGGSAHAAILLFDDFDGASGAAPNAADWTIPGGTLAQDGASSVVNTSGELLSVNTFAYEPLKIEVSSQGTGPGFQGYYDGVGGGGTWIMLRTDTNVFEVNGPGATVSMALGTLPSSYVLDIEWTASKIEMFIDGTSTFLLTNPGDIPTGPLNVGLLRYSTNATPMSFDSVQVGVIPEPASLSLMALGGLAMLFRRSRSHKFA